MEPKLSEQEKIELIYADYIASIFFYNPAPWSFVKLSEMMARFNNAFIKERTTLREFYAKHTGETEKAADIYKRLHAMELRDAAADGTHLGNEGKI